MTANWRKSGKVEEEESQKIRTASEATGTRHSVDVCKFLLYVKDTDHRKLFL